MGLIFTTNKVGSPYPTVGSSVVPSNAIEITTDNLVFFRRFDKEDLHHQYIILGKSMAQIAREKGCARSTVAAALVNLGFEIRARKDLRCSKGQVPFGFRVIHGNFVSHSSELEVINKMIQMKHRGMSYGEIAKWLNLSKIPTKNRSKKWDRPTVFKIIGRNINPNKLS